MFILPSFEATHIFDDYLQELLGAVNYTGLQHLEILWKQPFKY